MERRKKMRRCKIKRKIRWRELYSYFFILSFLLVNSLETVSHNFYPGGKGVGEQEGRVASGEKRDRREEEGGKDKGVGRGGR